MIRARRHRIVVVLAFLAVVATLATAVWRLSFMQGLDQLEARGEADLALASDRLVGQLQRYRDLAVLMADHPVVDELLQAGRGISGASDLLQR
ncbi:MAG: C4-dicarboxylate ABC transporter, partial [Rhodobacteraceae bacterium]|nr:C4-dicarboxylate ABC transporter [Paracoccaceae bacterium]